MKYLKFVLKNLLRNKRRTISTIMSIAFSLFLLATLRTVITELDRNLEAANSLRLIVRRATGLGDPLPESYRSKIQAVPGVVAITTINWFGGIYIDEKNFFAQFSCDPQTFFNVYTEAKIPDDQKAAFIKERQATIVGQKLATKYGWKLGERITIKGTIFPIDLELIVRGIYADSYENNEASIYFHRQYLEDALHTGYVGTYWIRADAAQSVPRIIDTIDSMFHNSEAETKTETEKAFQMGFISMLGNFNALIATISTVVIFTILLVTTNTMAMSVRERMREIAILKALGFSRQKVLALFLSESIAITLAGGLLGCLGARILFASIDFTQYSNGFFGRMLVTPSTIGLGLTLAIIIGIASAVIPAYRASALTISEGLRHVG